MTLLKLRLATRNVVRSRVPQHVIERLLLADVLAVLGDDHAQLALVVGRLVRDGELGDDDGCREGAGERGGRLAAWSVSREELRRAALRSSQEEDGDEGELEVGLFRVLDVLWVHC